MSPRDLSNRITINLPDDVRHWIETSAQNEERTKTSIVLRAIRAQMRAQAEQREVR